MTCVRRCTPTRSPTARIQPPACTEASWPESPIATTFAPARCAARQQPLRRAGRGHPGLVEEHHGALGQLVALLEVQQRAVKRPRRHAGLLGELAHRAAGRRDADHAVAGVLVDVAQRAGGERLAGARQGLDDVDAVARRRHRADGLGLLVGQRPLGAGQRPAQSCAVDDRDVLAGAPDGGGDQPPLGGHQILAGQPAGDGVQHVAALGEAGAAGAHVTHAGALRGGRRVLAQHVALGERVGLLGQPLGPGEHVADRALGARAVVADDRVGAAVLQQRVDRRRVQAVLARACADLLAPGVRLDAVLLALAGLQRPVVAPLPRVELLPGLLGGLARLPRARREVRQHLGRDVDELGGALDHRPPLQPQPLADLGAQMRLVEVPGGLGVRVQLAPVQRGPLAVGPARDVRADDVRVQLRVKRPRHPVPVGGGHHALGAPPRARRRGRGAP